MLLFEKDFPNMAAARYEQNEDFFVFFQKLPLTNLVSAQRHFQLRCPVLRSKYQPGSAGEQHGAEERKETLF